MGNNAAFTSFEVTSFDKQGTRRSRKSGRDVKPQAATLAGMFDTFGRMSLEQQERTFEILSAMHTQKEICEGNDEPDGAEQIPLKEQE